MVNAGKAPQVFIEESEEENEYPISNQSSLYELRLTRHSISNDEVKRPTVFVLRGRDPCFA